MSALILVSVAYKNLKSVLREVLLFADKYVNKQRFYIG